MIQASFAHVGQITEIVAKIGRKRNDCRYFNTDVGRYIDCYKRFLGIYPYKIIRGKSGDLLLKDRNGVCSPIPIKDTDPNCQHYDYIFKMMV